MSSLPKGKSKKKRSSTSAAAPRPTTDSLEVPEAHGEEGGDSLKRNRSSSTRKKKRSASDAAAMQRKSGEQRVEEVLTGTLRKKNEVPSPLSSDPTDSGSDGGVKLRKRSSSHKVKKQTKSSLSASETSSSHSGLKRKKRGGKVDRRRSVQMRMEAAQNMSGLMSPKRRADEALGHASSEELKAMVEANPSDANARVRYGDYLLHVEDDTDGAEQQYLRAIAAENKHAAALLRYAELLWAVHHNQDVAGEYFTKAAKAGKKDADLLNRCGLFQELASLNIPKAQELYEKAVSLGGPLLGVSYGNLARVLKAQKKYDEAEKMYKKGIKCDEKNALLRSNYGWYLESCKEDVDGAQREYEAAVELDDSLAQGLYNLARLLDLTRGDWEKARDLYERTIKADPHHSNAHLGLAMLVFTHCGDADRAAKHFEAAIDADRSNSVACFNYAAFLEQVRHDDEAALPYYFQATCLRPNHETFKHAYLQCLQRVEGTQSADEQEEQDEKQNKNAVLTFIRHVQAVPVSREIQVDFVVGAKTGVFYLDLDFHIRDADYIGRRVAHADLSSFECKVLLVHVNIRDCELPLRQLAHFAVERGLSLILAWNHKEAARYIETFKSYEHKGADAIRERPKEDYASQLASTLTVVRGINKRDVKLLNNHVGSLRSIATAPLEQLAMVPGLGEKKVRRLRATLTQPLSDHVNASGISNASASSSTSTTTGAKKRTVVDMLSSMKAAKRRRK